MQLTTMKALQSPDSTGSEHISAAEAEFLFFGFLRNVLHVEQLWRSPDARSLWVLRADMSFPPTSPGTPWNGVGWRGNNINVWSLHQHSKHQGRVTCTLHCQLACGKLMFGFSLPGPLLDSFVYIAMIETLCRCVNTDILYHFVTRIQIALNPPQPNIRRSGCLVCGDSHSNLYTSVLFCQVRQFARNGRNRCEQRTPKIYRYSWHAIRASHVGIIA